MFSISSIDISTITLVSYIAMQQYSSVIDVNYKCQNIERLHLLQTHQIGQPDGLVEYQNYMRINGYVWSVTPVEGEVCLIIIIIMSYHHYHCCCYLSCTIIIII